MGFISIASFLFHACYDLTVFQRALQSSDVVEAPRWVEHNFWRHRNFFNHLTRHLQLDEKNQKSSANLKNLWFLHHVEGVELSGFKIFIWLQKCCSNRLGDSTTSTLCYARWIKTVACSEQKGRNENEAHLIFKYFIDFHILLEDSWYNHHVGIKSSDSNFFFL